MSEWETKAETDAVEDVVGLDAAAGEDFADFALALLSRGGDAALGDTVALQDSVGGSDVVVGQCEVEPSGVGQG